MANDKTKELYEAAEATSFDLKNKTIILSFKSRQITKIPFEWIKNVYPQIIKLEEHLIK